MGSQPLIGVNKNCPNASNPYHRCTQACSLNTKSHHTTTTQKQKPSGYRSTSVTNGELGKKIKQEKLRTYKGCPKASNPYHECDDNCYKTLSDSGAPPTVKFERKKKQGSKPEPPVLDSVPPSKVGAIYLSDASSPISHHSDDIKKVELKGNDEHIPSELPIQIPGVTPVNHKEQLKDGTDPIQTNQEDQVGASPPKQVVPMINAKSAELGGTDSVISESRISVGGYEVKQSFASMLQSILDKYGDIGASCHLESVAMRSYYVECVCFVVQQLQSATSIMQLTDSKVIELQAIVKDAESAQFSVAWLRSALDEIAENIELINQHQDVEATKANSDYQVESLRKELELEMETLALKEKEVADIKTRIPEIRERLKELELKSSELDNSMLSVKSKVDNLPLKSLIDELL